MFTLNSSTKLIIPDPNKLMITEFKKIWDLDKTKDKKNALENLSYIYYVSDFKSPYVNAYSPEDLPSIVKEAFISQKNWKVTKNIEDGIKAYKELQKTKTIKLFEAADRAVNNLIKYFDTVDLSERVITDEEGNETTDDKVHDIAAKVMSNLQKIGPVATAIEEARKRVEKELAVKDTSSVRGKGILKSRELPKNKR